MTQLMTPKKQSFVVAPLITEEFFCHHNDDPQEEGHNKDLSRRVFLFFPSDTPLSRSISSLCEVVLKLTITT